MKDEHVMAVRTAELFALGYFHGVRAGAQPWLRFIFDPRHSRFLPRPEAELDPEWKQVIPYVILACADQVFVYRRGRRGSETRLAELHSIGLGGHIQPGDEGLFARPGWDGYQAGMHRELAEEVEVAPEDLVSDRLVGMINDDSTEVGKVHIGLIHIWDLRRPHATSREAKITAPRFAPRAELATLPNLETWSALCLAAWPALTAEPGWHAK